MIAPTNSREVFHLLNSFFLLSVVMLIGGPVRAEDGFFLKGLLMPGKVISGHAEYERQCENCHESTGDTTQIKLCLDCHEDVARDIKSRQGFHGKSPGLEGQECRVCHSEHLGRDADIVRFDKDNFDHETTDFELTGLHLSLTCDSCHKSGSKFRSAPSACIDCHKQDDRHQGRLGDKCQDCHSAEGWPKTSFDHSLTDFPLMGKHREASCSGCHPDQRFRETPQTCIDCHALNDIHNGVNGRECSKCHQPADWEDISFDHNKDTQFPLTNRHTDLACSACHLKSVFEEELGTGCIDCHSRDDFHNGRFGAECDSCHQTDRWKTSAFDHDRDTSFPLTGEHARATCESCHRNDLEGGNPGTACIDCHSKDDVHNQQQGTGCGECHNTSGWAEKVLFNHELTRFPLVGMHALASCDACHSSKTFHEVDMACVSCHRQDDIHKGTMEQGCDACHNPNDWGLWLFEHDQTRFPLEGKHSELECDACHSSDNGEMLKQSRECIACHRADDVHNKRFGRSCDRCHSTDSFREVRM